MVGKVVLSTEGNFFCHFEVVQMRFKLKSGRNQSYKCVGKCLDTTNFRTWHIFTFSQLSIIKRTGRVLRVIQVLSSSNEIRRNPS